MQIIGFERSEFCSSGAVVGEGLAFTFLALNETGGIEQLRERVGDDDWRTVVGPAPIWLQTLVTVAMANAAWECGVGPPVPTVIIGAAR